MSTVTFTFPHRWMFSLPQHWKKKAWQTYNFQRIFKGSFGSVSHTTTTKIEATRNKIPLKGLGTGLANPSVHSDPNISKVTYPLGGKFSKSSQIRFCTLFSYQLATSWCWSFYLQHVVIYGCWNWSWFRLLSGDTSGYSLLRERENC